MPNRELKLKQASAVLGVRPKDLQNLVQSRVLRPRRVGALYYFDRKALVSAKVALVFQGLAGSVDAISDAVHTSRLDGAGLRDRRG